MLLHYRMNSNKNVSKNKFRKSFDTRRWILWWNFTQTELNNIKNCFKSLMYNIILLQDKHILTSESSISDIWKYYLVSHLNFWKLFRSSRVSVPEMMWHSSATRKLYLCKILRINTTGFLVIFDFCITLGK